MNYAEGLHFSAFHLELEADRTAFEVGNSYHISLICIRTLFLWPQMFDGTFIWQ